jgi:hypothetical protein
MPHIAVEVYDFQAVPDSESGLAWSCPQPLVVSDHHPTVITDDRDPLRVAKTLWQEFVDWELPEARDVVAEPNECLAEAQQVLINDEPYIFERRRHQARLATGV